MNIPPKYWRNMATKKKTATKNCDFVTNCLYIKAAHNGYLVEEEQSTATGNYRTITSIFANTEALLSALEPLVRDLRDNTPRK